MCNASRLAAIALGTNIEPRAKYLKDAIERLKAMEGLAAFLSVSSVYETDPVGYTDQAAFLNAVIFVETRLLPYELLWTLQQIEQLLGRVRLIRWGPRTMDLDLLLYEGITLGEAELMIPHPRMYERSFVGIPLLEAYQCLPTQVQQRIQIGKLNLDPTGIRKYPALILE